MTINTTNITSGPYTGNGVTVNFTYGFRVETKNQLIVYETTDLGVQTTLTVDTDYTVNNIGVDGGGTITRVAGALPTDYEWYIRSDYQETQETAFASQGGFFPAVHEAAMDKLTFLIQQITDRVGRSSRFSDSYSGSASPTLPVPAALEYLRWNSDADGLETAAGTVVGADAAGTPFTPAGDIVATNVQSAIEELDTEKLDSADIGVLVQAYDATILNEADIGATVEAYDQYKVDAGHISGMVPSLAADTDHDITLSTGSCSDSAAQVKIRLTSAITKQIDAVWAAGDAAGGLFSGTVAVDTTYHMFLIVKDSDGSVDAGFDTNVTAANIPTGYTAYRRVFSFITDASANIIGFDCFPAGGGSTSVVYRSTILELSTTAPGTSRVLLPLTIPAVNCIASIRATLNDDAVTRVLIQTPSTTDVAAASGVYTMVVGTTGTVSNTVIDIPLEEGSSNIAYRSDRATGLIDFAIMTIGYTDVRN